MRAPAAAARADPARRPGRCTADLARVAAESEYRSDVHLRPDLRPHSRARPLVLGQPVSPPAWPDQHVGRRMRVCLGFPLFEVTIPFASRSSPQYFSSKCIQAIDRSRARSRTFDRLHRLVEDRSLVATSELGNSQVYISRRFLIGRHLHLLCLPGAAATGVGLRSRGYM